MDRLITGPTDFLLTNCYYVKEMLMIHVEHDRNSLLNISRSYKFSLKNFLAFEPKFVQFFWFSVRYANELIETVKTFVNKYF